MEPLPLINSPPKNKPTDGERSPMISRTSICNPSITFRHQITLPKLPIPPLQDTCTRYLEYIKALETPLEYEISSQCVKEFLETDGPILEEKLLAYAKAFIEHFWYESYLTHRNSVVLNVNPIFILEDDPTPSRNNHISRAASLILGSLKFIHALRIGTLEPDVWGHYV